uniref:NADH-ubiquinone oxidoreductase chain 3 n=1 Tax=Pholcus sp. HCP-2014 TaxID=1519082 RepID=A0A0U1WNP8_9ARAC|nr:NADH dehydrogenase subunit 3 [Pholcus sp. HCP-2014]
MFMLNVLIMFVLSLVVLLLFNAISVKINEDDYLGVYECGFDSIVEARAWFSYRFFLLGVLFIVFDVEISLLLSVPYCVGGGMFMVLLWGFMFILLGGTLYEIEWGSMDWV